MAIHKIPKYAYRYETSYSHAARCNDCGKWFGIINTRINSKLGINPATTPGFVTDCPHCKHPNVHVTGLFTTKPA